MAKLTVTRHADRDLDDILSYLTDAAGQGTAESHAQRFAEALEHIEAFPSAGPARPALGTCTRISIVLPYVLIYDYDEAGDTLVLLRVLHGRRRMTERILWR